LKVENREIVLGLLVLRNQSNPRRQPACMGTTTHVA
jgi:hypothetical protein